VKSKIYVPPVVEGKPIAKLVETYRGTVTSDGTIFTQAVPSDFSYTSFEFVDTPEEAHYALSPHGIRRKGDWAHVYAQQLAETMHTLGKKTVVFVGGDFSFKTHIADDRMIVLIGSQYKSQLGDNEIIVPPFTEDPFDQGEILPLPQGERPRVGFCGWASFPNKWQQIVAHIKKVGWKIGASVTRRTELLARQRGLLYRIAGIQALRSDSRIDTSFIIRSSFSAHSNSISVDPVVARREFVENMTANHFSFAPKGDGNFSVRFYEALAFGRIPVLVDTDMALPLEHVIPYEKCIVRVPHTDIDRVGDYVVEAFAVFGEQGIIGAQKEARTIYRSMLRYDAFFNELFSRPLEETLQASRAFYARRNSTSE